MLNLVGYDKCASFHGFWVMAQLQMSLHLELGDIFLRKFLYNYILYIYKYTQNLNVIEHAV